MHDRDRFFVSSIWYKDLLPAFWNFLYVLLASLLIVFLPWPRLRKKQPEQKLAAENINPQFNAVSILTRIQRAEREVAFIVFTALLMLFLAGCALYILLMI